MVLQVQGMKDSAFGNFGAVVEPVLNKTNATVLALVPAETPMHRNASNDNAVAVRNDLFARRFKM